VLKSNPSWSNWEFYRYTTRTTNHPRGLIKELAGLSLMRLLFSHVRCMDSANPLNFDSYFGIRNFSVLWFWTYRPPRQVDAVELTCRRYLGRAFSARIFQRTGQAQQM
jgi:hypothetical protein